MALDPLVDGARTGTLSTRCPACGAGLRPDAPWCSQCWHDLRVPPPPAPDAAPEPSLPPAQDPVPSAPGRAAVTGTSWSCRCGAGNDLARDTCATCGAGLFAVLRGGTGSDLVLPLLGDVAGLTRVQRGVAAGVLLAVLLAVLLVSLTLAGALLT